MFIELIVAHIIGCLCAFYVYNDSLKRYPSRYYGIAWSVLTYLASFLVLAAYMIIRPPEIFSGSHEISGKTKSIIIGAPIVAIVLLWFFYSTEGVLNTILPPNNIQTANTTTGE